MRAILGLAPHAISVVQDQIDGRELRQAEEHKFVEVTEPLAELTVHVLSWSGQVVALETLCTLLVEFLCRAQMEPGRRAEQYSRGDLSAQETMHAGGRSAYFRERNRYNHEQVPSAALQGSHRVAVIQRSRN